MTAFFSNVMIKLIFLNHDVSETLDGVIECAADNAFVLMFVLS